MQITVAVSSITVEITDDESKYRFKQLTVPNFLDVVGYFEKSADHSKMSFTIILDYFFYNKSVICYWLTQKDKKYMYI